MKVLANFKIRCVFFLALFTLFAYLMVRPIYDSYVFYKERDKSTIIVLAGVYGYEGKEEFEPMLTYLEELPAEYLNSAERGIVDRARYFSTDPELGIVLKKGGIIVVGLFIFYLIIEYCLTRTYTI
ncbi:hypothetical protein [Facklamia miroungae]|uniref:Uncharacterized protein n=1 Tax=Facklamia miroungae TaxID=120956 RepID=A0A1G7UPP0_9LACT|nr:hypothetical protein [Facklamia miroungae]NKZ30181.1 hypothetical protein [Facklamia miroungae]SDG49201.1 hypothetical protein SAMN05421791_11117 [Facklamia miroungae]